MADAHYYDIVIGLAFDGPDGSTTFSDYSPRHTQVIAPVGGVTISNTQSKFGGVSAKFNKAAAGFLAPQNWTLDIGTQDYTIQFWIYFNSIGVADGIFTLAFGNASGPTMTRDTAGHLVLNGQSGSGVVAAGSWNWITITRTNGNTFAFLNGVTQFAVANPSMSGLQGINIGRDTTGNTLDGYIDDFRITVRSGLFPNGGTPPTVANDAGTLPLTTSFLDQKKNLNFGTPVPAGTIKYLVTSVMVLDYYNGGNGRISGTVDIKGTPNQPVSRKVRLYNDHDGSLVREQWSDSVTGAYSFNNIASNQRYTVITYDHLHNFRAVVADNLTPDLTP